MTVHQDIRVQAGMKVYEGRSSANEIGDAFDAVKTALGATELQREVRKVQNVGPLGRVRWSLWVGKYQKRPSWLEDTSSLREERFGFLLLLETDMHTGVLSKSVGGVDGYFDLDPVDFSTLLHLKSTDATEYGAVSTRSTWVMRSGVANTSLSGRGLQRSLSRLTMRHAIPKRVRKTTGDEHWSMSPNTGAVLQLRTRVALPGLCKWFAQLVKEIQSAVKPKSTFLDAFAAPQPIDLVGNKVFPKVLVIDPGFLEEMTEDGWTLRHKGGPVTVALEAELEALVQSLWVVGSAGAKAKPEWSLLVEGSERGRLTRHSSTLSFSSDALKAYEFEHPDHKPISLSSLINKEQRFLVSFDEPGYAYQGRHLFHDKQLATSADRLQEVIIGSLPPTLVTEKGASAKSFKTDAVFGHVESHIADDEEWLVCEDMGTEWADFIGVKANRITFYHCKLGTAKSGASSLHEVVSQGLKNVGYLTAEEEDLLSKLERWDGDWEENGQTVPRMRRVVGSGNAADFIQAFRYAQTAVSVEKRIVLVVSKLEKTKIVGHLNKLSKGQSVPDYAHQMLWLLTFFVESCKAEGIKPLLLIQA